MSETLTTKMPPEIVVNDDLALGWLIPDDAETLFPIILNDPEIKRNVTWPANVHSLDGTRRRIERLTQEEDKSPYVLQKNGVTIGFVGAWGVKDNEHEIGFSYFLAKNRRGHGYITFAVRKMMEVAMENLPIETFAVNITDTNKSSQAIAAKLGFKATDILTKDKVLPELIRRYERPAYE